MKTPVTWQKVGNGFLILDRNGCVLWTEADAQQICDAFNLLPEAVRLLKKAAPNKYNTRLLTEIYKFLDQPAVLRALKEVKK